MAGCRRIDISPLESAKGLSSRGFSLVELTVVLLLITLIASVAVRETSELAFQTRYEQTKERLEMIKQAILGNPRQIINGQQAISGFVADMGRLPNSLRELLQRSGDCSDDAGDVSQYVCEHLPAPGTWTASAWNNNPVSQLDDDTGTGMRYGWNGPYLSIANSPADDDALGDAWGSAANGGNYGWRFEPGLNPEKLGNASSADDQSDPDGFVRLVVQSLGRDQVANALPTNDYIDDYPPNQFADDNTPPVYFPTALIDKDDWLIDIRSGISVNFKKTDGGAPTENICMKIFYRTSNSTIGVLVSDEDLSNDTSAISFDAKTITADGSFQTIRFNDFRDSQSPAGAETKAFVPIGSLAIGIYQFNDTSCKTSASYYPADRQSPIQVDFHPHTTLPVINW